jgi:hypothetical protein
MGVILGMDAGECLVMPYSGVINDGANGGATGAMTARNSGP